MKAVNKEIVLIKPDNHQEHYMLKGIKLIVPGFSNMDERATNTGTVVSTRVKDIGDGKKVMFDKNLVRPDQGNQQGIDNDGYKIADDLYYCPHDMVWAEIDGKDLIPLGKIFFSRQHAGSNAKEITDNEGNIKVLYTHHLDDTAKLLHSQVVYWGTPESLHSTSGMENIGPGTDILYTEDADVEVDFEGQKLLSQRYRNIVGYYQEEELILVGNWVFIKSLDDDTKTSSGNIWKQALSREHGIMKKGLVVLAGPDAGVKAGDKVYYDGMYGKHEYKGDKLIYNRDEKIFGTYI